MDRKTNINNLTIVWQGQSWSVIAPNGKVLARCVDKWEAVRYAKSNTTYISTNLPPENYVNSDFIEFETYIYSDAPKSRFRIIEDEPFSESETENSKSASYRPEKRKRYTDYAKPIWRDAVVDRIKDNVDAKKVLVVGLLIIGTVIGVNILSATLQDGVHTVQATLASIDWGALIIQAIIVLAVIVAGFFVITFVGAAIMTVVVIGATLLGLLLACGVLTSLVIGWPWKF